MITHLWYEVLPLIPLILGSDLQAVQPGCYRSPFCLAPASLCPHRWDRCDLGDCAHVLKHTPEKLVWILHSGLLLPHLLEPRTCDLPPQSFDWHGQILKELVNYWWEIRMPSPMAAGQCVPGALCISWQPRGWSFVWTSLAECDCVHGECNGGVAGNGSCTCYGGYTGPRCDQGKHTGTCRGAGRADQWHGLGCP